MGCYFSICCISTARSDYTPEKRMQDSRIYLIFLEVRAASVSFPIPCVKHSKDDSSML